MQNFHFDAQETFDKSSYGSYALWINTKTFLKHYCYLLCPLESNSDVGEQHKQSIFSFIGGNDKTRKINHSVWSLC